MADINVFKQVEGTCKWFTNHRRFKTWKETGRLLWISGDPGCGKSTLAKYLIDKVLPESSSGYVCYFFFKDDFSDQRSPANAICALIRQLLISRPDLPQKDLQEWMAEDGQRCFQSLKNLWKSFVATAKKLEEGVVCVLDALDECREEDRATLIQNIINLSQTPTRIKFLMTSRPYIHIQREFQALERRMPTIRLRGEGDEEVEEISKEINTVIRKRVQEIGEWHNLNSDETKFLQSQLGKVPNRTYLWVHLVLDVIKQTPGFSRGKVRQSISQIPENVDAAYEKILNRSSDHKKARELLYMIIAAARPLLVDEVNVALAMDGTHRTCQDLEQDLESDERFSVTVRDLCGLFVVIVDQRLYLLHQTAKEFLILVNTGDIVAEVKFLRWKHSIKEADSHRFLAQVCLWYLALQDLKTVRSRPLLFDYATKHWTVHFREARVKQMDNLTQLALDACQPNSKNFGVWFFQQEREEMHCPEIHKIAVSGTGPLSVVSCLGLVPVVCLLLDNGASVDSRDHTRRTPLSWAACSVHSATVQLLEVKSHMGDVTCLSLSGLAPSKCSLYILTLFRCYHLIINHSLLS